LPEARVDVARVGSKNGGPGEYLKLFNDCRLPHDYIVTK
jgi:hypothetical protein